MEDEKKMKISSPKEQARFLSRPFCAKNSLPGCRLRADLLNKADSERLPHF
jgi:hypothetical protein